MSKAIRIVFAIVIVLLMITAICFFIPAFKEVFLALFSWLWTVFQSFFLVDSIKKLIVYAIMLLIIGALGVVLTKSTKKKAWAVAGGIVDMVGIIIGIAVNV